MKRILFVFTLVLVIFIQSPLLLQYNESELEGFFNDNCSYMDIKSTGDINNVEEFSKAVEDFSEKENAFVATLGYDTQTENKKEITHLYIAGSNVPSFFNRYGLTSKAINNSNENINVSLFNPNKTCVVNSFEELENKNLSRTYYIYPEQTGSKFKQYMTENYNVDFFTADELIYIRSDYIEQLPGIALMIVALLVFFSFWIVSQYQANAVKKLLGYSDISLLKKIFFNSVLLNLLVFTTFFILQFFTCGIYNKWNGYKNLLLDSIKLAIPLFIVLTITEAIFIFLFYNSEIKYALKGRRPYILLNTFAAILKCITIFFLCSSIITIGTGINQTSSILKQQDNFEKISNCHFTQFRLTSGSPEYLSEFEKNGSEFYLSLDGVLMDNRDVSMSRDEELNLDNIISKTVFINSDYLEINPILDENGQKIQINENEIEDNELIILVPEKLKNIKEEIYKSFDEWYQFARYVTVPTTELPETERNVTVKLVFVQDNQTYFAFDTDAIELEYNYISDPFGAIVTKHNMDKSYYSNYVCNSKFYIYENEEQTLETILETADRTNIINDLVNVPTVHSAIDNTMQQCKTQLVMSVTFLSLIILIVELISIYIIKNYMEQNRKTIFIKKMLGYSIFNTFGKIILIVTIIQTSLFLVLKFVLTMHWNLIIPVSICFLLIDFIVMLITSLIYQKSLTKNVLKGE